MRFFLQGDLRRKQLDGLLGYEYFEQAQISDEEAKARRAFKSQVEFSFFAVKLGWSKAEYNSITPLERAFIMKEFETQQVKDTTIDQGIYETAIANVMRSKGKPYRQFWRKNRAHSGPPITQKELKKLQAAYAAKFSM